MPAGLFENIILQFFVEQRQAIVPPAEIHLYTVQSYPLSEFERIRVCGLTYRPVTDCQLESCGSFFLLLLSQRSTGACHCKPGGRTCGTYHHLAAIYV